MATNTSSSEEFKISPVLNIGIITIFPDFFLHLYEYGMTARALNHGFLKITTQNPREFSDNRYKSIDEPPYGGGAGMVMRYEPLKKSHEQLMASASFQDATTIYLSPQGLPASQKKFQSCVESKRPLIFICGRYEGIDQRLIDAIVDEEWSVGDYILSGGELAATLCVDAMARQIPGVLHNRQSIEEESFSNGLLEYPHYTKPREIDGLRVPEILFSGNHAAIDRWRRQQSLGNTWLKRPDLLSSYDLSAQDDCLLEAFKVEYLKSSSKKFTHS